MWIAVAWLNSMPMNICCNWLERSQFLGQMSFGRNSCHTPLIFHTPHQMQDFLKKQLLNCANHSVSYLLLFSDDITVVVITKLKLIVDCILIRSIANYLKDYIYSMEITLSFFWWNSPWKETWSIFWLKTNINLDVQWYHCCKGRFSPLQCHNNI